MTNFKTTLFAVLFLAGIFGRIDTVNAGNAKEVATFGGGCFWCLEAVFEELQGVYEG